MDDISSIKLPNGTTYTVKDSTARNHISDKNNPHGVTAAQTGAVSKAGDTMTGGLNAPQFMTGEGDANFFQSRKFRGEGDAGTYYHAVDFGYYDHNKVDFYEYGGVWNFYKNTTGKVKDSILIGQIVTGSGWAGPVNGHSIDADVPSDAKFTDTTYSAITNAKIDSICV